MPTDFISPVETGAGLYARGQQLKLQRQAQAQEDALFPLRQQAMEYGLQAQALNIANEQYRRQIELENKAGLTELNKLLASHPDYATLRPQINGLLSRYPHIAGTREFLYATEGVKIAEQAANAQALANIRSQTILKQTEMENATRLQQEALRNERRSQGFAPSVTEKEYQFTQELEAKADAYEAEGDYEKADKLREYAEGVRNKRIKSDAFTVEQLTRMADSLNPDLSEFAAGELNKKVQQAKGKPAKAAAPSDKDPLGLFKK